MKKIFYLSLEPLNFILFVCIFISIFTDILKINIGQETNFFETIGIFFAIFLSISITVFFEKKSEITFEKINKISENIFVKVIREGKKILINYKDVVVGDILILEPGDKIPADCRILYSEKLFVDESLFTGESKPVNKISFQNNDINYKNKFYFENILYSGSYVLSGNAKVIVISVGKNTEYGKLLKEIIKKEKKTIPLQEKFYKFGKIISVIGISISFFIFFFQLFKLIVLNNVTFDNIINIFIISIVLIIAIVPEGLTTIISISLALNSIKLAKKNALVKKNICV